MFDSTEFTFDLYRVAYRIGQKVRRHFLQSLKKQFRENLAEDDENLTPILPRRSLHYSWCAVSQERNSTLLFGDKLEVAGLSPIFGEYSIRSKKWQIWQ